MLSSKYPTLEQNQRAWQDLVKIHDLENKVTSYINHYTLDSKLLSWSRMRIKFGISFWHEFTGIEVSTNKYLTLEEHQRAWQDLVKKHDLENKVSSYINHYTLDPKLLSWSGIIHRFNICSWYDFIEKKVTMKYLTLEEHQRAWQDLVKKHDLENKVSSYKNHYTLDQKLLSWGGIVHRFNICSWYDFIEKKGITKKHPTLKEYERV